MTDRDRRGAKISMQSTNAKDCCVCGHEFKEFEIVYDCPLQGVGFWGFLCNECVDHYGRPKMGTVHTVLQGDQDK